jgi:hypothetical protein
MNLIKLQDNNKDKKERKSEAGYWLFIYLFKPVDTCRKKLKASSVEMLLAKIFAVHKIKMPAAAVYRKFRHE